MRNHFLLVAVLMVPLSLVAQESNQERTRISVIGIRAINAGPVLAEMLAEHLESVIYGYPQFSVVTRTDIKLLIEEKRLTALGLTDENSLVQAGSLLGVEKVLTGTISCIGQTCNVVLRVIDAKSGSVDIARSRQYTGELDKIFKIADQMCEEMFGVPHLEAVPVSTDSVASTQPNLVLVGDTISSAMGAQAGLESAVVAQTPPATFSARKFKLFSGVAVLFFAAMCSLLVGAAVMK